MKFINSIVLVLIFSFSCVIFFFFMWFTSKGYFCKTSTWSWCMARGNSSTFFWCYKSIFTSIEEGSAGLLMKFDLLQLVFIQDTARIVICLLHNFLYQLGWQVLFSMIKKFKIKVFFSSFLKGNFFYFKLIFFASVYELYYLSFVFFYFPIMYLIFLFSSENSRIF